MKNPERDENGIRCLLGNLWRSRKPIERAELPEEPGIYALFLADNSVLPRLSVSELQPLYIGISDNLARRQLRNHFDPTQTGWSTVRRSIGAMLREDLKLTPRPRGQGETSRDCSCYCFRRDDEQRLSVWMRQHLLVGAQVLAVPSRIETRLIVGAHPPLNMRYGSNLYTKELKRLRKACADEAWEYARRFGALCQ